MVKRTFFLLYSHFKYRCAMIHSGFLFWLVILVEYSFGQAILGKTFISHFIVQKEVEQACFQWISIALPQEVG